VQDRNESSTHDHHTLDDGRVLQHLEYKQQFIDHITALSSLDWSTEVCLYHIVSYCSFNQEGMLHVSRNVLHYTKLNMSIETTYNCITWSAESETLLDGVCVLQCEQSIFNLIVSIESPIGQLQTYRL